MPTRPTPRRGAARRAASRRGFTLIELLVVVLVIGLLAGLVGPRILGHVTEAKSATARTQISMLGVALDSYGLDNGGYPTTEQGLAALQQRPNGEPAAINWRGPYLARAIPADPWGRPYRYQSPGEHNPAGYDLWSYGRDDRQGGEGDDADVVSWQ
jgi:general secretion pathway protein G